LGGVLFELECAAAGAALEALRHAPGVIDAAIFGDKLHVLLHDASDAAGLPALLAGKGIEAAAPRAIPPTLEDVFVQLVTRPRVVEAAA
jgi:ABC-2 type transport system ATP-binding protein